MEGPRRRPLMANMSFGKGGLRTRQVACGAVGIMGKEESGGGEKKKMRPASRPPTA